MAHSCDVTTIPGGSVGQHLGQAIDGRLAQRRAARDEPAHGRTQSRR